LSEESALCIADSWLITGFIEHQFTLDEQSLSHPLHILGEVSIELISLLNKGHREDQNRVVRVNGGPGDRANHERHRFSGRLEDNSVILELDNPLFLHEGDQFIEVISRFESDALLKHFFPLQNFRQIHWSFEELIDGHAFVPGNVFALALQGAQDHRFVEENEVQDVPVVAQHDVVLVLVLWDLGLVDVASVHYVVF
jgi:hypothetical protein